MREVDVADSEGTFELVVHVSDQKTYVCEVSFAGDKIDKVVPKNKVEKGAFSEDVFNDVKKFLNSNFLKDKLNQKILLDK